MVFLQLINLSSFLCSMQLDQKALWCDSQVKVHCWHQAVRIRKAQPGDRFGDVSVDTEKSRAAYRKWLELTRSADQHSPDGTRRPYWMLRPVRPERDAYRLPDDVMEPAGG